MYFHFVYMALLAFFHIHVDDFVVVTAAGLVLLFLYAIPFLMLYYLIYSSILLVRRTKFSCRFFIISFFYTFLSSIIIEMGEMEWEEFSFNVKGL